MGNEGLGQCSSSSRRFKVIPDPAVPGAIRDAGSTLTPGAHHKRVIVGSGRVTVGSGRAVAGQLR